MNGYRLIYSPRPMVEHDNWLDRAHFVEMMKVSMRVQAAVFLAFALRRDTTAVVHLLRMVWYLAQDRLGIGSAAAGLYHFATGVPWALRLLMTEAPPLTILPRRAESTRVPGPSLD